MQALLDEQALVRGLKAGMNESKKFSCDTLAKNSLRYRKLLVTGERGMAREHLAASGKSLAELAAQYRSKHPNIGN